MEKKKTKDLQFSAEASAKEIKGFSNEQATSDAEEGFSAEQSSEEAESEQEE